MNGESIVGKYVVVTGALPRWHFLIAKHIGCIYQIICFNRHETLDYYLADAQGETVCLLREEFTVIGG